MRGERRGRGREEERSREEEGKRAMGREGRRRGLLSVVHVHFRVFASPISSMGSPRGRRERREGSRSRKDRKMLEIVRTSRLLQLVFARPSRVGVPSLSIEIFYLIFIFIIRASSFETTQLVVLFPSFSNNEWKTVCCLFEIRLGKLIILLGNKMVNLPNLTSKRVKWWILKWNCL